MRVPVGQRRNDMLSFADDNELLGLTEAKLHDLKAIWTAREITQQPSAWLSAARLMETVRPEIRKFLASLEANPDYRIILTGAGTSAKLCPLPQINPWRAEAKNAPDN